MTDKNIFDDAFPQDKQIGGNHYRKMNIQPYEFISKNNLSFFQGCVVKYVCRYLNKSGIEDLEKIIHYCQLEDNGFHKYLITIFQPDFFTCTLSALSRSCSPALNIVLYHTDSRHIILLTSIVYCLLHFVVYHKI